MKASPFIELNFSYSKLLKRRFREGSLRREWRERYPQLFMNHDERLSTNQKHYHFHEWLAAVLIYEAFGMRSRLKWMNKKEPEKHRFFNKLVGAELAAEIYNWLGGHPDLLICDEQGKEWFFCEVKGPGDKIRPNQTKAAERIEKIFGQKVYLLTLLPH